MASNDATPASNPTSIQPSQTDQPYRVERPQDPRQGGEGQSGEEPRGHEQVGNVQSGRTTTETSQREEARPAVVDKARHQDTTDKFDDPSLTIWPMYLAESKEEDKKIVENMTTHTNGVLVFTGLFGAIVAAFIVESYKQLQPDSGSMSVALLAQISQQIAASSNGTHSPAPYPDTLDSLPFRPSSSALRVNILWFLSLSLSLSCALAATLMQQWVRRYISNVEDAQRAGTVQNEGLIHAHLFLGLQSFRFKTAVEALPALLHASVILFFVGLVDFLFDINNAVAYALLSFVVLGALIYLGLTVFPIIWPNSPYATPLSLVVAYIVSFLAAILCAIIQGLEETIKLVIYCKLRPLTPRSWRFWAVCAIRPWRSHAIASIVLFPTAIIRAIALEPGELMQLVKSGLTPVPGQILQFMKSNFVPELSDLVRTMAMLQLLRHTTINRWRTLLTASTREKLFHAAISDAKMEPNTLRWTLVTVMDDDTKLGKCIQCSDLFIRRRDGLQLSGVQDRGNERIAEFLLLLLRNTDGLKTRLPSVLRNIAVSLKSADEVEAAALRERAKSCLHLMRVLQNDGMKLYLGYQMGKALSELRQDIDTELAISATCTSALFHFHNQFGKFFAGPAEDTHPDEADLKDVNAIWSTNHVVDTWNVHGAIAFVHFTQSVLPHLNSVPPESMDLVWKTFGYDVNASGGPANSARKHSWDVDNKFQVGCDLDIKWKPGPCFMPADPYECAKLVSGTRRLRTTILDAEFPDPLDADHPIDSLPEPREMYGKLYNNLRQLFRFFVEYEALVRAAADAAPTASVAGPSSPRSDPRVHLAEPDPDDDPQDSGPQLRSTVTVPNTESIDECDSPNPKVGVNTGT